MAGNDESEGPGIMVVSLKGEQRPVAREPSGSHPRPDLSPSPFGPAGASPAPSGPGASPAPFGPGAAPATSPSPFGGQGEDPNAAIFGGAAPAAPRSSDPPSLDLEERAPEPAKKKLRPELAEWGQQLVTGEHAIPGGPAASAPGIPSVPSRPAPDLAAPPPGGTGRSVGMILALVVVGGLGFGVWRMVSGPAAAPTLTGTPPEGESGAGAASGAAAGFVLRPENAPDCWTSDDGFHFVYKSSSGEDKAVSTITEVPVLYRMTARCVAD